MPSYFTNSSVIGVDLNNTSTTQLFALGTVVKGSNDTEWVYVQAQTAITAFKAVHINGTFSCGMASVSDVIGNTATNAGRLGWAQNAFAASEYGWVPYTGAVYIMTTGSNTLSPSGVPVCCGGSAVSTGMSSMVATSTGTLQGITIVAHGSGGQTASATCPLAVLSWPRYTVVSMA